MACEHIKIDGHVVIVCGVQEKKKFCGCGRPSEFECDWKMPRWKSGTCDRSLCSVHAKEVARGKHLCPEHLRAYAAWKKRRAEQPSLFAP
jgi:hypothetical protein